VDVVALVVHVDAFEVEDDGGIALGEVVVAFVVERSSQQKLVTVVVSGELAEVAAVVEGLEMEEVQ
jgi:hypothetical protein